MHGKAPTEGVSFRLTGEAQQIVEGLAQKRGATTSEIVGDALAMAAFFDHQQAKGALVLISYDRGNTLEEVCLLFSAPPGVGPELSRASRRRGDW